MSANKIDHARTLLNRVPAAVQHACDLDLVVFFARHSRTLMTGEDLARLLGYEIKEVAKSLEVLLKAGLLTRAQTRPAQGLYLRATHECEILDGQGMRVLPRQIPPALTRPFSSYLNLISRNPPRHPEPGT